MAEETSTQQENRSDYSTEYNTPAHMRTIQGDQQQIIEEVVENWQDLTEEDDTETPQSFAEALKGWYDNQMQDLHDSRGDAEYQKDQVAFLRTFRDMVQAIKDLEFGFATMEQEIAEETQ